MSKIQDLRGQLMDGGSRRPVSRINKIALHYSGTKQGDAKSFERHWKNTKGWTHGGYHRIVLTDGTLQICYNPEVVTNGVLGHNTTTFHICYVGDGQPNSQQLPVIMNELLKAMNDFNCRASDVLGHREFSGARTACPGANMTNIRQNLGTAHVSNTPAVLGRDCSRFTCKGLLVKHMQENLLKLGELLPRFGADGDFGQETEDAVKAFQARHNLIVDGIAGTQTLGKIGELIKSLPPAPKPEPPKKEEPKVDKHKADKFAHEAQEWVRKEGISDGTRPRDPLTRQEAWVMMQRLEDKNKRLK